MGWFGFVVPEAEGGSGVSAVEHALFYREVGRHCGPVDILSVAPSSTASATPCSAASNAARRRTCRVFRARCRVGAAVR